MFKTRLISGIVLVAIAFVIIGGNVLLSAMGIISLICLNYTGYFR